MLARILKKTKPVFLALGQTAMSQGCHCDTFVQLCRLFFFQRRKGRLRVSAHPVLAVRTCVYVRCGHDSDFLFSPSSALRPSFVCVCVCACTSCVRACPCVSVHVRARVYLCVKGQKDQRESRSKKEAIVSQSSRAKSKGRLKPVLRKCLTPQTSSPLLQASLRSPHVSLESWIAIYGEWRAEKHVIHLKIR